MNITDLLSNLVSLNSVYPNEKAITELYTEILKKLGFKVKRQKVSTGRYNLLATRGNNPKILFYGHQDTVPVVDSELWEGNPFTPRLNGYRLYGLGAYDMKGGIAAFLHALSQSDRPAKVFLAVDEEYYSQGAWFTIQNTPEFFENIKLVISAEPNFGLGLHGITVGRTGRVIFDAVATGKAEHISKYKQAEDAIEKLNKFIQNFYKQRGVLFSDSHTVGQIKKLEAESVGMSVCSKASAQVEILPGAKDSISHIQKQLSSLGDVKITPIDRPTPFLTGYSFDSFPYQDKISTIISKVAGEKMTLHHRSSVGDDNAIATLGIPVITWGPNGDNAHKPNEWVSISSLKKLSIMYQKLLQ